MNGFLVVILGLSVLCETFGHATNYQERIVSTSARSRGSPESRIIGGERVTIEEYPFAVSLQNNGTFFGHQVEHFCGGGIVGEKWIITSAQCALRIRAKAFHVRAGTSRYYENGDIYSVQRVVIHPAFNAINYDYDVGLVQLSDGIKFDVKKQPIKLPETHTIIDDGSLVRVVGWGASEYLGPVSDELLRTTMRKISDESCQRANTGDLITNRMFCVSSEIAAPCIGDSGSPLVYRNLFFGVASWSRFCGTAYPTTFTAISVVKDWISEITGIA